MRLLVPLSLLWSLVNSQTVPYVSFNGMNLPNHGYVDLSEVGDPESGGDSVQCHTNLQTCCSSAQGSSDMRGDWFFPNDSRLSFSEVDNDNDVFLYRPDIYQLRLAQRVELRRRNNNVLSPSGIYCCDIATIAVFSDDDDTTVRETVYVGIYGSGGNIMISDGVTLTVVSDLNGASSQFTLTCISTGGPATTVTWTRDSQTAVGTKNTIFNSATAATTAEYTHTLTVTERLGGLYTCTVANTASSNSSDFIIGDPPPPTNLKAKAGDDLTSILLTWTPSSGASGYIISYDNGAGSSDTGSSGDETVDDGSTDNHTLNGLQNGTTYNVSIFATSIHFNSDSVQFDPVRLVEAPTDVEPPTSRRDDGGGNAGAVAAGVLIPLIIIAAIATVLVVGFLWWRRRKRSKDSSSSYTRTSSPPRPPPPTKTAPPPPSKPGPSTPAKPTPFVPAPPVQYKKSKENKPHPVPRANDKGPVIVRFPEDTHVQEGEGVLFQVEVTGVPQPKLRWYHDGEEVVADYSKELSEDGTLTMPSAETKHSGVYQLVAVNKAGSIEREVKLFVKKEGEPSPYMARKQISFSPIPVDQLGDYVAKSHASDNRDFRDQYTELDKDADYPKTIGTSPNLKLLNRFANITVYDNNRVTLRPIEGHSDCQRDFINACYVDGYKFRNKFIATQGPLPKTVVDFWRLVWQEKPLTIVMVTNLVEGTKTKCQQYWPDSATKSYGPFQVTITDEQTLADYTTRSLLVQLKGSSEHGLKVTQFHFTAWPDHGVPDYATPILAFHRKIKKHHRPSKGPVLVHCSAGVGRTGTLITIDRALDQIQKERVVDIAGIIQQLRNQRMKMVQNPEQYIFIHDAILEAVTCGDTQIAASDLRRSIQTLSRRDPVAHCTGFENQYKVLEQVSPNPREVKREKALDYPNRNRSDDFLPSDRWRVVLKGDVDDYIHAVVVHGYKQQRAFIIAQSPMQSTARDFWKMVSDRKCGVIVMLNNLVENGKEVCYQYWPSSGTQTYGEFTIELLGEEELSGFTLRTFGAFNSKSGKSHQVSQFHITNWAPDGSCGNLKTVTDVIEEVGKVQRRTGNHPILAHCSDTVSRSGMFCAIATTIERCKTEGVVDVFQVVKALRVQKPGAVRSGILLSPLSLQVQYQTVFEAVLDSFDTYSNF